jgi:8-oxo-dGTP pyrophosphatase MutT (NUDIX family)
LSDPLSTRTDLAVAVSVVIRRADGRILLVRRAEGRPAPGYWTPITGKLEPGEGLLEAALREAAEEVGLQVEVEPAELGRTFADRAPYELVWFLARPAAGVDPDAVVLAEREVAASVWVDREAMARVDPMFPTSRAFLLEKVWGG